MLNSADIRWNYLDSSNESAKFLLLVQNCFLMQHVLEPTFCSVVISGDGWFYDFGDSNRAFKRDCTVYTGY